jgi:hypothetical protein
MKEQASDIFEAQGSLCDILYAVYSKELVLDMK